jgi:hypothetical protein
MLLRKSNKVTGNVDLDGVLNRRVGHLLICLIFDDAHGVLIEAMRDPLVSIAYWERRKRIDNPIVRFWLYIEARRWWSAEEEEALKVRLKVDVMQVFKRVEVLSWHELGKLFTDVYAGEGPWNIVSASLFDDFGGLTVLKCRGSRRMS